MTFNPKQYIINLRGKDYLPVAYRVVWFRDANPDGTILTEISSLDPLIIKAEVSVSGRILATGFGSANAEGRKVVWTGREIEKAETAAIGRALAHAGYGTQFTGEDEGDNLADSPVEHTTPDTGQNTKHQYPPAWVDALIKHQYADNVPHAVNMLELSKLVTPDAPLTPALVVGWGKHYIDKRKKKVSTTEAAKLADQELQNYLDKE